MSGTTEKEFGFPQGQANVETIYEGNGGIELSNLLAQTRSGARI
jgi:uncharacterized membrane protein (UPF0182 family)